MNILTGIRNIFRNSSSEWCFCAGAVAGMLCPLAAPAGAVFLKSGQAFCYLAGVLGVLITVWGAKLLPAVHFPEILDNRSGRVEYVAEITDHRITTVEGLGNRNAVAAILREIRPAGEKKFQKCRGELIFYSRLPVPPVYGSIISGEGTLFPPEPEAWSDLWQLQTDIWRSCGVNRSWRHYVFKVRDMLMARICSGISDDDNRNLAAAFFFGFTGGMTPERRSDFAAAGTIHLFAVSGLHVGMFAFLVLLMLRLVPFRSRYFIAAVLTWGYVLLTGAAVPAVRAGIMITLFLLARGMLYKVSPWRLLGAAAGIAVIVDPGSLHSMGFQYSFLITAVLLLISKDLKRLYETEKRKFDLMPFSASQNRKRRIFNRSFSILAAVISGTAAVAAGSIVSVCNSIGITPGAVIANWFTMPVLGILFILFPIKLLSSCCTEWINSAAGSIISAFFDYLLAVAEIAADIASPFYSANPGILYSLLLVVILLFVLAVEKLKYKIAGAMIFAILFTLFPLMAQHKNSGVAVISSDCSKPASIVVLFKRPGEAAVINPVYAHIGKIEKILKDNGIFHISEVRFSEPSVKNLSGLRRLASSFKVIKVIMPPDNRHSWRFRDRITETPANFYYTWEGRNGEKIKILREKNKFAIEYPESGVMLNWKLEICYDDNGRKITFRRGNEKSVAGLLPWSDQIGVLQYEL